MSGIATITPAFGDDDLSAGQARDILINTLSWGGIAVVPSDTCIAIAALPTHRAAIAALDALLDHAKDPIPLSVGSYSMATRYVELSAIHGRVLNHLWPGSLTLVADAARDGKKILQPLHHARGDKTLGVRMSRSLVERYLSSEADCPLTTAAVRDDNGNVVKSYDEAVDIILSRLHRVDAEKTLIVGVKRKKRFDDRAHSTVAQINGTLKVLRVGEIPESIIRPLMNWPGRTEYGDAT